MEIDYNKIFDLISSPYLLLAPNPPIFTIIDANHSYLEATMTIKEVIIGKSIYDVFSDNPSEQAAAGIMNLRKSLDRVVQEKVVDIMAVQKFDIRRSGGSFEERLWSPINSPVISDEGNLYWIIHQVVDATDYMKRQHSEGNMFSLSEIETKSVEAEVVTSRDKLKDANLQLKSAQETINSLYKNCEKERLKLERSNKGFEQFTLFVSHDLQEPIRAIKNYLTDFVHNFSDQLKEVKLGNIHEAIAGADRLQMLILDLLRFSRFTSGKQTYIELSIQDIIENAVDNLYDAITESKAKITIEKMPVIYADKSQMIMLFQNLISNAIKYRRGTPEIHICSRQENDNWIFSISDNGIGIEAKHFETIFLMFQRLFTQEDYPGTGVGLALCKRIVENHGGRIWVNSKVNEGSTFYFSIPAGKVHDHLRSR
jgi:signal transduction histidine kinase